MSFKGLKYLKLCLLYLREIFKYDKYSKINYVKQNFSKLYLLGFRK